MQSEGSIHSLRAIALSSLSIGLANPSLRAKSVLVSRVIMLNDLAIALAC